MSVATKSFYSVVEASARWGTAIREIIDWSAGGAFALTTFVGFAECETGPIAGSVEISAQDILAHFRIEGPANRELRIYRIRQHGVDGADWVFVRGQDGQNGIEITPHEIYIAGGDFVQFQEEHALGTIIKERVVYRTPAAERHDWESMYRRLCKRIFESGLPEHLQELAREMQEWFIAQSSDGEAPDISTIRKRLQPIWNDLREVG